MCLPLNRVSIVFGRCREKQRKESSRLQTVNRKMSAMNKLLMEENDRLQKQVSRLVFDNGYMKNRLHSVSSFSLFNCTCAWTKNGLVSWCMACCILTQSVTVLFACLIVVFPLLMLYLVLLAITFACKFAAFCSHHRHKLWVCGDKWSAQPTAKPSSSASSTKGCEQPSRVSLKPDYIRLQTLCLL